MATPQPQSTVSAPDFGTELANLGYLESPVAVASSDLVVLHCNDAFQRVTGCGPGDRLDRAIPELGEKRCQRKLGRRQRTAILGKGQGRREETAFEYILHPTQQQDDELWIVEGLDQSRAQSKDDMLESFTKTIELNNRRLAVQERAIADLLNNLGQAVFSVNKGGRICSPVSAHAQQIFGRDITGELVSDLLYSAVETDSPPPWKQIGQPADDWQPPTHLPERVEFRDADGNVRYLEICINSICRGDNEAEKISKILFVVEDITLFVKLEEENLAHMEEIVRQHRNMKLVLDNVDQGFITTDATGSVVGEHSAIVDRWFAGLKTGDKVWEFFSSISQALADDYEMSWMQVEMGFLPLDLCLDQMPSRFVYEGRSFFIQYSPVLDNDELSKVVLVITDKTAEVERAKAETAQREFLSVVSCAVEDVPHFRNFVQETEKLLDLVCTADLDFSLLLRGLHTLKGNFGIWKLSSLAEGCHHLEDSFLEIGEGNPRAIAALREQWNTITRGMGFLLEDDEDHDLNFDSNDYWECLRLALEITGDSELTRKLTKWRAQPVARVFERLSREAEALAERLHKTADVTVEHNGIRLPKGRMDAFFSTIIHVIRNAVDHGLPASEEGSPPGQLHLRAQRVGDTFFVAVQNDGAGIDWERLKAKAEACGLSVQSPTDLENALFADGISTKDTVSEISGRGVGLSCVREEVERLGGTVQVHSEPGQGAEFRFCFPASILDEDPKEVLAVIHDA